MAPPLPVTSERQCDPRCSPPSSTPAHPAGLWPDPLRPLLAVPWGGLGQTQGRHWTWPLEPLGPWTTLVLGGKVWPTASLSVTHWTPLAEGLGGEEGAEGLVLRLAPSRHPQKHWTWVALRGPSRPLSCLLEVELL